MEKSEPVKKKKYLIKVIFTLLVSLFAYLTVNVFHGHSFAFDEKVFSWFSYKNDTINTIATYSSFFGSQKFLLPANILLITTFLFIKKYRSYSWKIGLVTLSSAGFLFLSKYIIKRPRPLSAVADYNVAYGFPSGHAFTSVAFFGIIIYFVFTYIKNPVLKYLLATLTVVLVLLIGWSRVYLHVHYASDVIAGYCLGGIWMILSAWFLIDSKEKIR